MSGRGIVPVLLGMASIALVAGAVVGGVAGALIWAVAVPPVPAALAVLAAPPRAGRAVATIALMTLVAQLSLIAFALQAEGAASRVAGLSPAAWWMLIGLGLGPLVGVPLLYAASFRDEGRSR